MLTASGMNPSNPHKGWLKCLINCLGAAEIADTRKPYLILDGFGVSSEDAELLMAQKPGANTSVILVLTVFVVGQWVMEILFIFDW